MTRITDSRLYGNQYPLAEVMSDLTSAIFDADASGNVNTFRQNLQMEYVNRLVAIITPPGRLRTTTISVRRSCFACAQFSRS